MLGSSDFRKRAEYRFESISTERLDELCLREAWPPTEEENGPTSKIGQKYTKKTERILLFVFLMCFCPIFGGGCISLSCRGPSVSQSSAPNLLSSLGESDELPDIPRFEKRSKGSTLQIQGFRLGLGGFRDTPSLNWSSLGDRSMTATWGSARSMLSKL